MCAVADVVNDAEAVVVFVDRGGLEASADVVAAVVTFVLAAALAAGVPQWLLLL